ncbi:MAG: glutathione S-transferase [Candidatus Azotimanducaceae bacterium]|jgi:glutathione S-transferase
MLAYFTSPLLSHNATMCLMKDQPILYTFRRCPYAIRARMALAYAEIEYEHREVILKNKPAEMITLSPKGTVPVFSLNETLIEESLDILLWSLSQNDPEGWMNFEQTQLGAMASLVERNDFEFKNHLDHYKYADRFPEYTQLEYRERCESFLAVLEALLNENVFLFAERLSYADIAILSFVRQFSKVDEPWFDSAPYPKLRAWLKALTNDALFLTIMKKYKAWSPGDEPISGATLHTH